ncbi:hypothetical protein GCM10009551_054370 [Nocardiopsis tropica]|uniref:hypothetical protein n=1 Tax=Tsukamurella strandjordii TaxID=147577 RepID=UPI0031D990FA
MTNRKYTLPTLTAVLVGALIAGCDGPNTGDAAPSSAAPSVPAGATLHPVDAPLSALTSVGEHCFGSVADALAGRQRARDDIADRNGAFDAKERDHAANPANPLPAYGERRLKLAESTPTCYKVTPLDSTATFGW